jgi:hypothetical protein
MVRVDCAHRFGRVTGLEAARFFRLAYAPPVAKGSGFAAAMIAWARVIRFSFVARGRLRRIGKAI